MFFRSAARWQAAGRRWLAAGAAVLGFGAAGADLQFNRDIRPILSENCFFCHGADAKQRKGDLRLDTAEGVLAGRAVVPGRPDESELIRRIFTADPDDQMPPADSHRRLTDAQKTRLRMWVEQGAKYDAHWAFQTPARVALPDIAQRAWPRNPVDHFILARLESEGLKPSAEAPPGRLLRRVALDLTGLPPTPEQLAAWRREADPFAAAVDELLASPRFGERLATDWLDVARYADTHGFNNDSARSMWRWRDWVIEAFNRNLSYDRFITEQLAGDLLPAPTFDQRLATGFNRNHVINSEGGIIDEEYRVEYVADRVRTTSLAWLGLTLECARCHDHKFDPVSQRDYYRLFAFFNQVDEYGEDGRVANAAPIMAAPTRGQQERIAELRGIIEAADRQLAERMGAQDWSGVKFDVLRSDLTNAPRMVAADTNRLIALDFAGWQDTDRSLVNDATNGQPFSVSGSARGDRGPGDEAALQFDGDVALETPGLPNYDAGKGWRFSAWVRRDRATAGTLLSTMSFDVPASSQGYGRGVEIRLTERGAVEVRAAVRWPAYALAFTSRETLPVGEWTQVTVVNDGSAKARGFRVLLNGEECFRELIHDDLTGVVGPSGRTLIGGTRHPDAARFAGSLAAVELVAGPTDLAQISVALSHEVSEAALKLPATNRAERLIRILRQSWLERQDAAFAQVAARRAEARAALLDLERDLPTVMVMRELAEPRPSFVLHRGQYNQPRERVEPGVPDFLLPFPAAAPRNRLGLAQWLTDPRHPLTARVVVNRFWQSLFGAGLVKSVEDFGYQADWPSHPELLDWLAVEFVESGWDVKGLLRLLVTSAAYRQDSRSTPALNERDPENRLLARGPRQRLTAEMLRDQALLLGGLLVGEVGGPSVFPYQPRDLYQGIVVAANYPGTVWEEATGDGLYRRSLYTFWKRTVPHPELTTFDAPDREFCVARRLRTNTPLQALAQMNAPLQLEAARKLAERMLAAGGGDPAARLAFAFECATARPPSAHELRSLRSLLERRLTYYAANGDEAVAFLSVGASPRSAEHPAAELAAYANVAGLILNLDETLTRN